MGYLVAAYAIIWLGVFGYLGWIALRLRGARAEMDIGNHGRIRFERSFLICKSDRIAQRKGLPGLLRRVDELQPFGIGDQDQRIGAGRENAPCFKLESVEFVIK